MDKDFMQYVYARIEKALIENTEYMRLQSDSVAAKKNKDDASYAEIECEMDAMAQELCYMQGYEDGMRLALKLFNRDGENHER